MMPLSFNRLKKSSSAVDKPLAITAPKIPNNRFFLGNIRRNRQLRVHSLQQPDGIGVGQSIPAYPPLLFPAAAGCLNPMRLPVITVDIVPFQLPKLGSAVPCPSGISIAAIPNNRTANCESVQPFSVINQASGQKIGVVIIQVIKQLIQISANAHLEFDAEVIGKALRQDRNRNPSVDY
ncbi:MAG: hypothetical protein GPOALKHO_000124 [Sodalis sp.]|nr:MAG: hypothetical protein GPOALKHO_000124 [Sodalis sp.]